MANLVLSKEEFEKEIKVVMEERRLRTEDRPQSLLNEQLMATAFIAHPYHSPVVGWMSDLESMTWHDAREWYDRWYAPNNAILVIAGSPHLAGRFAKHRNWMRFVGAVHVGVDRDRGDRRRSRRDPRVAPRRVR